MLDAIESATLGGMDVGALGSVMGKNRREQAEQRVEAAKLGKSVRNQEQLEAKVREVAEDFVSVFMNQIMKSMRATVHENPAMHGDNGEKFFQELLDTEQSKTLAKGSGYGLTDLIYQSMMASYRVSPAGAEEATEAMSGIEDTTPVGAIE